MLFLLSVGIHIMTCSASFSCTVTELRNAEHSVLFREMDSLSWIVYFVLELPAVVAAVWAVGGEHQQRASARHPPFWWRGPTVLWQAPSSLRCDSQVIYTHSLCLRVVLRINSK
jgi:hypothetical protein